MNNTDITDAASLQQAFHTLIPISKDMGVKVLEYDGVTLSLNAPIAPNHNHQNSAFGGSLFSIAALAGWGLIQLKLSELKIDANTVIAGGEVSYELPVYSDLICQCSLSEDYNAFVERLQTKGKASLTLNPHIILDASDAMSFKGKFVVKTKN